MFVSFSSDYLTSLNKDTYCNNDFQGFSRERRQPYQLPCFCFSTVYSFFSLVCSMFVGAISSQHLCVPRCDCMGIVCTLQLPTAHKLTSLQIGFYLNLEDTRLEILFNNNLFLMEADGTYKLFFYYLFI